MYSKIKEMKQKGFKKRSAARQAQVSRETIDKYWDMEADEYLTLLT